MSIVHDLIPHMRRVQGAERDLRDLSLLWQMIEASSAISCPEEAESILPMLTQTRVRFAALQSRLVEQLGQESLAELRDELASTAQCTIDILVRNLYERTADVGFLATDEMLRAFCSNSPEERDAQRPAFVQRLAEYRAKYTVYDDIVLLGPQGQVLARLDSAGSLERSDDPIVAQALSRPGYCEQFAISDLGGGAALGPGQGPAIGQHGSSQTPALLYAHRVEDAQGRVIGVLVLRFRSANEMEQIFADVVDGKRQVALLLLDGQNRVITSIDEAHVPVGAQVQAAPDGEVSLSVFAGREYLSVSRATLGYQGYTGPAGWRAHAMVSLLTAFRGKHDEVANTDTLSLDNPELARIQSEVDAINSDLRRVVWNGRLVAGAQGGTQARLKAVLTQVNAAGLRTRDRVALAIRDLYRSSLGRAQYQANELARLAADIMDRNLYERANDCRWWALSPVLQRVLAAPASAVGSRELNAVLSHINSLYTVYSRLVAFDAQGLIRGVSNDEPDASLIGGSVEPELLAAVAELNDSQRYAVTPFAPSPLGGGKPTYVYLATVRPQRGSAMVGGIAIVFNSEREFRAMLGDVLARQSGIAAFVDGEGRVIACTDDSWKPGQTLPFKQAGVAEHLKTQYAVACVRGTGYREFKRSDGYDNQVHAVVALRLGEVERRRAAHHDVSLLALPAKIRGQGREREFALFHVGEGRYALPARTVLGARPRDGLVKAPVGSVLVMGLLEVPDGRDSCVIPVVCARRYFGVSHAARVDDGVVLVLASAEQPERPRFGLMVDQVSTVLDVDIEHIQAAPSGLKQHSPALEALIRVGTHGSQGNEGTALVQLINPERIAGLVVPPLAVMTH